MDANNRMNMSGTLNDNFSMFTCSQCDTLVSFFIIGNKTVNGFYTLCNESDMLYFIPAKYRKNMMLKIYNSINRLWYYNLEIQIPRCIHDVATICNEFPLPGKGTIENLNKSVIRYNV